jgi:hypothetical protein
MYVKGIYTEANFWHSIQFEKIPMTVYSLIKYSHFHHILL